MIDYEWDETKERLNRAKHGVAFEAVQDFDWATALLNHNESHGELRTVAYGRINRRLHVLVFTERGDVIRIISLRKANGREEEFHGRTT